MTVVAYCIVSLVLSPKIFSFSVFIQEQLVRAVEESVRLSPEYRCMQSQFSVLYNESLQLKAQLDEARCLLHGTRSNHNRQLELIEVSIPLFFRFTHCCVTNVVCLHS